MAKIEFSDNYHCSTDHQKHFLSPNPESLRIFPLTFLSIEPNDPDVVAFNHHSLTGSPHIRLEHDQISVSRVFCVLWSPFCCKLHCLLVRGLEPRLRKSGTRKFLGGSDH